MIRHLPAFLLLALTIPGILLVLLPTHQAHASCVGASLSRRVVPEDGTTDFPTNGRIRVLFRAFPEALRERMAGEYRLRAPDGQLVPLKAELDNVLLTLTPQKALLPGATYVVESVFAYEDGRLLSDERRWRQVSGRDSKDRPEPGEIKRFWYPLLSFSTADGPDRRVPTELVVRKATLWTALDGESLAVTVEDPADLAPTDLLGLEVKGQGVIGWGGTHRGWAAELGTPPEGANEREIHAGDMDCTPDKVHIDVSKPPRVRGIAVTAAGTRSRPGLWSTATPGTNGIAQSMKPAPRHEMRKRIVGSHIVDAFFSPSPDEPTNAPPPGPATCPNGVQATSYDILTSLRWIQNSHGRPRTFFGDRGWVLAEEKGEKKLFLVPLDGSAHFGDPLPLKDVSWSSAVVPSEGEVPVIVAAVPPTSEAGASLAQKAVRVFQPGVGDKPLWERLLGEDEASGATFAVSGGGRVLVGWTRRRKVGEVVESWPAWAVLDALTGEVQGRGDIGDLGPVTGIRAVGWDGEHFAIEWEWVAPATRPGKANPVPIRPNGAFLGLVRVDGSLEASFSLPSRHMIEYLAPTSDGWVGAWNDWGLRVGWFDRKGTVVAGPFAISEGSLGGADDIAANGDLAAVAGRSWVDASASVVIIDRKGGISPAFELGRGRGALSAALEPLGDGFIAAYGGLVPGEGWAVAVERLSCRSDRPIGPPPVIGTTP